MQRAAVVHNRRRIPSEKVLLGLGIGYGWTGSTQGAAGITGFALLFGMGASLVSYFAGDQLVLGVSGAYVYLQPSLPTAEQMKEISLQVPLRIYARNGQVMAQIGAPGESPEGRFFPDTYAYSRGVSDLTVLKRAHETMRRRLAAAWAERDPSTPLRSMDEALILASIVEKETARADERPPPSTARMPYLA